MLKCYKPSRTLRLGHVVVLKYRLRRWLNKCVLTHKKMISLVVPSSTTQVSTGSRGEFEAAFRPLSPGLTGEHEEKISAYYHVCIKHEVFTTFTSRSS